MDDKEINRTKLRIVMLTTLMANNLAVVKLNIQKSSADDVDILVDAIMDKFELHMKGSYDG